MSCMCLMPDLTPLPRKCPQNWDVCVECHMNYKMDLLLLVFVYMAQVTPGLPKQT